MPCFDYDEPRDRIVVQEESPEQKERHNLMCRLACEYLTGLESAGEPIPAYAQKWWGEHKKWDKIRVRLEARGSI